MKRVGITRIGLGLVAAALAAPLAAQAAGMDFIDAYYVPDATVELGRDDGTVSESTDADGFGIKLATMLGDSVFLAGELLSISAEGFTTTGGIAVDGKLKDNRIGLGYNTDSPFYVLAEYVRKELSLSSAAGGGSDAESGWGVHVGAKADVFEMLTVEARVGYLDIGKNGGDGLEYLVGLGLNLDRNFGLFADYRVSELENKDKRELNVEAIRTGLRFRF